MAKAQNKTHQAIIIGSGFAGLCMGVKLKAAGVEDFIILEKAEDLGGTWRENTYPGAECDIPSTLYSFSFEHNAGWNYKWSEQAQILEYQHHTANKYGLTEHFRFNQRVVKLVFSDDARIWRIETGLGEVYEARHVVSAVGQLHVPRYPELSGQFRGASFHSAQWDHSIDLKGKRVGVIGNAASALQFIPEIQPEVSELYVFQRSPNWVLPKMDRPYARWEQWLSGRFPWVAKLYRLSMWLKGELALFSAIKGNRLTQWALKVWNQRYLKRHIKDPALRAQLTPDYPVGAKRILFSDNYYSALAQPNVALVTEPIAELYESGVRVAANSEASGDALTEYPVDILIFGTGFVTNPFLSQISVYGRDGRALEAHWRDGAHAYLGLSTHGFPNLHFMYGPNTNLGHNSILIMLEAQANAIVRLVEHDFVEVDAAAEKAFDQEQQRRLNRLEFSSVDASWYKVGARVTNNWAGRTTEYRRRLKHLNLEHYQFEYTP